MKTDKHEIGGAGESSLPDTPAVGPGPVSESRRSFTKSGLAISGVVLTLASRPVLGDFVCKSPSGFLSGNVSATGIPQMCSGLTPGFWGNHPERWPSPYVAGTCTGSVKICNNPSNWTTVGATKFNSVFSCANHGSIYSPYTMLQVIWSGGGGDPYQLGAHIIAALLNARQGLTPVLTEAQVINMFNEWDQKGYFEPTAGVQWDGADIVAYLQTTMS